MFYSLWNYNPLLEGPDKSACANSHDLKVLSTVINVIKSNCRRRNVCTRA